MGFGEEMFFSGSSVTESKCNFGDEQKRVSFIMHLAESTWEIFFSLPAKRMYSNINQSRGLFSKIEENNIVCCKIIKNDNTKWNHVLINLWYNL